MNTQRPHLTQLPIQVRRIAFVSSALALLISACGSDGSGDGDCATATAEEACQAEINAALTANRIGERCDRVPVPTLEDCLANYQRNGCTGPAFCYFRQIYEGYETCLDALPMCAPPESSTHGLQRARCLLEAQSEVAVPIGMQPACTGG